MTLSAPRQQHVDDIAIARSALVESAYSHLRTFGQSVSLAELARVVYRTNSNLAPSICDDLQIRLLGDSRFYIQSDCWALVEWHLRRLPCDEVDFVAFDVETNGGRSGRHRIIELGAVRFRGPKELGRFQSLVSLATSIPQFVTDLTGISTDMLQDAPSISDVLKEFALFSQGAVLVAHNLVADLSYINHESVWGGLPYFSGEGLDTMELHAAFSSDGGQVSLAAALAYFGESEPSAHRALADANAVRKLLSHFIDMARVRGATTVEEIHRLTLDEEGRTPLVRRRHELARWASLYLPALPGVYILRNRKGDGLYVGKSNSLQRRVRSHFTPGRGYSAKWDALLEETAYIDHEVAGSDLAAILREDELITDIQPPYNIQLSRRPSARILRIGPMEDPIVGCVHQISDDNATYFGPYRNASEARSLVAAVRRTFGLPSRRERFEVGTDVPRQAASIFLSHGKRMTQEFLENESRRHTGVVEKIVFKLRRLRIKVRPVPGSLAGERVLAIHHGIQPGDVEFRLIAHGLIHDVCSLQRPGRSEVREVVNVYREARLETKSPQSESKSNLLLAWLHQRYGSDEMIVLGSEDARDRSFRRVWGRVKALTRN